MNTSTQGQHYSLTLADISSHPACHSRTGNIHGWSEDVGAVGRERDAEEEPFQVGSQGMWFVYEAAEGLREWRTLIQWCWVGKRILYFTDQVFIWIQA